MPSHWRPLSLVLVSLCQLLLLLSLARGQDAADNRTELRILYITSFGGEYDSSGSIPAVEIALEQINNRSDILEDYRLVYEVGDSQVGLVCKMHLIVEVIARTARMPWEIVTCACTACTEKCAVTNLHNFADASMCTQLNAESWGIDDTIIIVC